MTFPTARAAPVLEGMMLLMTERPVLQSRPPLESTGFCFEVEAWMVDMRPFSIPKESFRTLARGARQLVVQLAFETICMVAGS